MREKSNLGEASDSKKQTKQARYHEKHKVILTWIKKDLKELLKRIGDGSTTKGSEIALDVLLRDSSICKMILTKAKD
jgi:hypothetical protein